MKKFRVFCLVLCLLPLCLCVRAASEDASVTSGCHSVEAQSSLGTPDRLLATANAVIAYDLNSDTLLYSWNADATIYPSSMVKLMACLVALENSDLSDEVTVNKSALNLLPVGSVSAGLSAGEVVTVESLLYAVMVASTNDAAVVLAEAVGGSQEGFAEMMNAKAEELGCTGTHYSNATGLHDEGSYTTARDLLRILEYALENETFYTMFCTPRYVLPASNVREEYTLRTTNYLMSQDVVSKYYDSRVTGGKTGYTSQAGRCLVATAEGNGMNVLTILMGADELYEEDGLGLDTNYSFTETSELLDYVFDNFEFRQIYLAGQTVTQYHVTNGDNDVAAAPLVGVYSALPTSLDESRLNWVWADEPQSLTAPVEAGDSLSTLQLWYGGTCVAQMELFAVNSVPVSEQILQQQENATAALEGSGEQSESNLLAVALTVLGLFGALVLLITLLLAARYAISRARRRAMRRRRRASRRRSR